MAEFPFATTAEVVRLLQADLAAHKWALLPARQTRKLFPAGSKEKEAEFHELWDHAVPQRDENHEEVYPYKGSLVSYFRMDVSPGREFNITRSRSHNWKSHGSNMESPYAIEHIDPTTVSAESKFRLHRQWPAEADRNPYILTLQRILFEILSRPSAICWEPAPGTLPGNIYEPMMTAYRVTKKRRCSDGPQHPSEEANSMSVFLDAEPGPEGIHQDLAELTVIVLVNRDNVAKDSAGNRVWALEQCSGKPTHEDVKSSKLLKETVLRERFDALFVLDREVKHEALPIEIDGGGDTAVRDVLTFEVRRLRTPEARM